MLCFGKRHGLNKKCSSRKGLINSQNVFFFFCISEDLYSRHKRHVFMAPPLGFKVAGVPNIVHTSKIPVGPPGLRGTEHTFYHKLK